jgi:hypothetical protein
MLRQGPTGECADDQGDRKNGERYARQRQGTEQTRPPRHQQNRINAAVRGDDLRRLARGAEIQRWPRIGLRARAHRRRLVGRGRIAARTPRIREAAGVVHAACVAAGLGLAIDEFQTPCGRLREAAAEDVRTVRTHDEEVTVRNRVLVVLEPAPHAGNAALRKHFGRGDGDRWTTLPFLRFVFARRHGVRDRDAADDDQRHGQPKQHEDAGK